jgi:hypothetical protein
MVVSFCFDYIGNEALNPNATSSAGSTTSSDDNPAGYGG